MARPTWTDLEWHMRQALLPFDDDDRAAAEASRRSSVAEARVSEAAQKKPRASLSNPARGEGLPVHGSARCAPIQGH